MTDAEPPAEPRAEQMRRQSRPANQMLDDALAAAGLFEPLRLSLHTLQDLLIRVERIEETLTDETDHRVTDHHDLIADVESLEGKLWGVQVRSMHNAGRVSALESMLGVIVAGGDPGSERCGDVDPRDDSTEPEPESGGWRSARGALRSDTPAEVLIGRLRGRVDPDMDETQRACEMRIDAAMDAVDPGRVISDRRRIREEVAMAVHGAYQDGVEAALDAHGGTVTEPDIHTDLHS